MWPIKRIQKYFMNTNIWLKYFMTPSKSLRSPSDPPPLYTHTHTHHYILHVLALITFLKVQPFYDFFLLLIFTFLKNIFINEPESHKVLPIFMISSNFSFDITNIFILLHSWGLSPRGRCERRPEP